MAELAFRLGTLAPIIVLSIIGLVRYPKGNPWRWYFVGLGLQIMSIFGEIAENRARLELGEIPDNNITVSIITIVIGAVFFAAVIFFKTRKKDN